ncbi:MAG: aminopeptidase [Alicyclobacillaceae bacterium]|nr:aminopeptidase [Alicyclobacillaceae bacterium]
MMDPRVEQLARTILEYSVSLRPGDKVLIDVVGVEVPLAKALVRRAYELGGVPFLHVMHDELWRELLLGAHPAQMADMARWDAARMREMDCYVGLRAGTNVAQLSDVPAESMQAYQEHYWHPVHSEIRVKQTRWVVLRYPNAAMAQLANMSTEAFEDFYFRVCNLDYRRMSEAMDALVDLMERTDTVHITGPGTNLTFSINGIPAVKCAGRRNIPDGEVFTAPVRDSVEGHVTFNVPSVYQGFTFENVRLEFAQGRVVKATANDTDRINRILDTDEGARYIGEFSLGFNPHILHPMKDILFDEKIAGSFHFTPGQAYQEAWNGNTSAIHWDLVCIQRPEFGGGEVYFDGRLIRKDGLFVAPELECLNPDALV